MYGRNQDPVKAHDVYIPIFYIASLLTITKLSLIESYFGLEAVMKYNFFNLLDNFIRNIFLK